MNTTIASVKSIPMPLQKAVGAFLFALAMGVAAQIRIPLPFTPVPITLQTLVLMTGAGILTRHYALQMVAWYLAIGMLGLPLFSGFQGGISVFYGATGGYLVGFVFAALIIGYAEKYVSKNLSRVALYFVASLPILVLGALQLMWVRDITFIESIQMGVLPFVLGDVLKVLLSGSIVSIITIRK